MSPIFKHGPSARHRLLLVLILSIFLIFFDHYISSFETTRGYLQSLVSPLQYLATAPKRMMTWTAENLTSRQDLIEQNQRYKVDELLLREQLMQLSMLEKENTRLRSLLASPVRKETRKMVAEVIAVDSDPYTHQVVINRGANDGVYEGQPVVDEKGIVGQIQNVGTISSRVILITDVTHAVPVRVYSKPVAEIDRLRYLLLLWTDEDNVSAKQSNVAEVELKDKDAEALEQQSTDTKKANQ